MNIHHGNVSETIEVGEHKIRTTVYRKPKYTCEAIGSDAKDNKHILLIDYDQVKLDTLFKDINHLYSTENLGPFFIYQTDIHSYHLRCPAKVTYHHLIEIIKQTHCDHKILDEIRGMKRRNCNRVSGRGEKKKPVMEDTAFLPTEHEISKMHWDYIKKHDADKQTKKKMEKYEERYINKFDNSNINQLRIIYYGSSKE